MKKLLEKGPSAQDSTWYARSGWVGNNYSDDQIISVMRLLFFKLDKDTESEEADELRNVMDIFWYAISNDDKWNIETKKWLKELGEEN